MKQRRCVSFAPEVRFGRPQMMQPMQRRASTERVTFQPDTQQSQPDNMREFVSETVKEHLMILLEREKQFYDSLEKQLVYDNPIVHMLLEKTMEVHRQTQGQLKQISDQMGELKGQVDDEALNEKIEKAQRIIYEEQEIKERDLKAFLENTVKLHQENDVKALVGMETN